MRMKIEIDLSDPLFADEDGKDKGHKEVVRILHDIASRVPRPLRPLAVPMKVQKIDNAVIGQASIGEGTLRDAALANGFVLIRNSERRFSVVKLSSDAVARLDHDSKKYHTYLQGSVVCGPAKWAVCQAYIAANSTPLPRELEPT